MNTQGPHTRTPDDAIVDWRRRLLCRAGSPRTSPGPRRGRPLRPPRADRAHRARLPAAAGRPHPGPPRAPDPRRRRERAPEHRDRGRRPGRRQGGADAARRGLRRAPRAGRRRRPSAPTSARRSPRTTCAARPSATRCTSTTPASTRTTPSSCAPARARRRRSTPAARTVTLADGERLPWDRLLLATGAEPRRLPLPGADLDGVLTLRTLADSDAPARRGGRGRPAGGDRRRLDRLRGRGLGAAARAWR